MSNIPNIDEIKAKMKVAWNSGDYGKFATYMEPGAIEILKGWNISPGQTMLDVACGSGQISIPAARAGVKVRGWIFHPIGSLLPMDAQRRKAFKPSLKKGTLRTFRMKTIHLM